MSEEERKEKFTLSEVLSEMLESPQIISSLDRHKEYMKLHQTLPQLEQNNKVKPKDAAKGAGIPYSTYQSLKSPSKKQISPEHLIRLAKYFSVSIEELLGVEKMKTKNMASVPTKQIFSRWLKITVEDVADEPPENEE